MRTIRTLTTGLATLTLLATTTLGVAAQSPIRVSMEPVFVTGTVDGDPVWVDGKRTDVDGVTQTRGVSWTGSTVTSTDTRLAGAMSYTGNWDVYPGDLHLEAAIIAISGEQGGWSGTSTDFLADTPGTDLQTIQLVGNGVYEGLSAYLVVDSSGPTPTFKGIIFPGTTPKVPAAP